MLAAATFAHLQGSVQQLVLVQSLDQCVQCLVHVRQFHCITTTSHVSWLALCVIMVMMCINIVVTNQSCPVG